MATDHGAGPTNEIPGPEATDEEIIEYLQREYGYAAWMYDHPELRAIILEAHRGGKDEAWVESRIKQTAWYQTLAPQHREWVIIENEDPARARDLIARVGMEIRMEAMRLGVYLDDSRIQSMARDALAYGWVDINRPETRLSTQLTQAIVAESSYEPRNVTGRVIARSDGTHWLVLDRGGQKTAHQITGNGQLVGMITMWGQPIHDDQYGQDATIGESVLELYGGPGGVERVLSGVAADPVLGAGGGEIGYNTDALMALAREFMVPMSEATALEWAKKIAMGQATKESFSGYITDLARSRFPHLSSYIDQGISPGRFFDPYREYMAQLLEVTPDSIDLMDPRWSEVTDHALDDGTVRPLNFRELGQHIRKLPEWRGTSQAAETAADLGEALLREFGLVRR